ncbi:lipopolysaccharide biosynthesis protein [Aliarcobacter cryaerophilus]|uniref:lipopolysaccharide biosynthesis protein n=1 Tax=Aliarcobacter cryaerophilus TaxID=28198 RepID=UPI0021B55988|nr:lipopolysaccharide biosynthesis protein [Aliarcobacter cryaerophilus]MCT7530668.1 lipopolysaccharide biosynthesis protein [Aliarcobacter cryaerophilus]
MKNNDFSKNVLTLMTGTTIAQAIPIAISPILTRIYTPEDFGVFALYLAIVSILVVFTTGQYDLAIMLPKYEKSAISIVKLSLIINTIFSISIFIVIFIFFDFFQSLSDKNSLGYFLYFIPLSVFLIGCYNTMNYWLNRKKQYKMLSTNKVIQSLTSSTSSMTLGIQNFGKDGLIISQLLAQAVVVALLIKKIKMSFLFQSFEKLKIIAIARRYIKFPKITMMQSFFSNTTAELPIIIISSFFALKDAGFYSLAQRVVASPISIISSSFFQVFYQSFTTEKNKQKFYKMKFIKINAVLLPPFILLWFFMEPLFGFVFGEEWVIAGVYSQIILPLLYMKFLSNLFTTTTYLYYERQIENFILSIIITITAIASLFIGVIIDNLFFGLIAMSVSNCLVILFKLYRSYNFVKKGI